MNLTLGLLLFVLYTYIRVRRRAYECRVSDICVSIFLLKLFVQHRQVHIFLYNILGRCYCFFRSVFKLLSSSSKIFCFMSM